MYQIQYPVRLELLTKMQKLELFDQMRRLLLYYADKTVKYKEFITVHELTVRGKSVYVDVDWFYVDYFGQGDVYVTQLTFTTKENYEKTCSDN